MSAVKSPNRQQNPNARSSEINNPMRRSFSGNPFAKPSVATNPRGFNPITPANSPTDFLGRNSIGRESFSRDYEDKENGKDQNLKSARVRSPAAVSKGVKNFMSPTISAASKITASPRKKILVERNESVRTSVSSSSSDKKGQLSVSFSDIVETIDPNDEIDLNQKELEVDHERNADVIADLCNSIPVLLSPFAHLDADPSVPEMDLNQKDIEADHECNADAIADLCNSSPVLPSPLAPLDADPSVPPYDPKTNYLSPRPQFLHYRPNPRIEVYLCKDRLEDSFIIPESFSDSDVTEETQSEDVSEAEMVKDEEELDLSVPAEISTPMSKETNVEEKMVSKPQFFSKSKTFAAILVLLIACLSVSLSDYHVMINPAALKDSSFSNLYVASEFAQANFNRVAHNSQVWTAKFLFYISRLISDFEVHKLGPLQFSNLTDWDEDYLAGGYPIYRQTEMLGPIRERDIETEPFEEKGYPEMLGPIWEREIETEPFEEKGYPEMLGPIWEREIETEPFEERAYPEMEEEDAEFEAYDNVEEVLAENGDQTQETGESNDNGGEVFEETCDQESEVIESDSTNEVKRQSVAIAPVIESEVSKPEELLGKELLGEDDMNHESIEMDTAVNSQSSETVDVMHNGLEKILTENVLAISLLVLALCAAAFTAFIHLSKAKTPAPVAADTVNQALVMTKKFDISPKSASSEHSLRNWPAEVHVLGESCPSQMSSCQKSSSSYGEKGLKRPSSKAQSNERKLGNKRESLASSSEFSTDSPSYGSFTTYERIAIKNVFGDEEVVTPVRRSSRLRSQVTSP